MTRRNLRSSNAKFEYISLKASVKDGEFKDGPSKNDPNKDLFEFDNYLITHTPETLSISIVDQIGDDLTYMKHDANVNNTSESSTKILSKPLNLRKYNSSTRNIRSKNVKSSDLKIIKSNINKLSHASSSSSNINYINQFHKKCEANEKKMVNSDKEKLIVEIDTYLTNLISLIKEYDSNTNYNNINYSNYLNYNNNHNNLLNKLIFKNFKYPYSDSYPFNKINNRGIINGNGNGNNHNINYKLDNLHHNHNGNETNGHYTNGNSNYVYDTENSYNLKEKCENVSENEIVKLVNNFKINKNLINKLIKLTKLNDINDSVEIKMKLKLTIKELKNYINTFNYLKNKEIYLKKELKEFDILHNHNHGHNVYGNGIDTDSDNDSDNDIMSYIKSKESGIKNPINLKILKKKRNFKKFKKYGPLIKVNFYNGLSLLIDPILPPKIEFK